MAVSVADDVPQQSQSSTTTVSSKEYGSIALEIHAENLKTSSEDATNEDQQMETETVIDQNPEEVLDTPQPTVSNNTSEYSKIFVGGLEDGITDEEFFSYFEQFGRLVDKVVIYDYATKKRRGFGFVTYDNKQSALNVLEDQYHEVKTGARKVEVKRVLPKLPLAPIVPAQQQNTTGHNCTNQHSINHDDLSSSYNSSYVPLSYCAPPYYPYQHGYNYIYVPYNHMAYNSMAMPYNDMSYNHMPCNYMPMQYNHMSYIPYNYTPMPYNHLPLPYNHEYDDQQSGSSS